MQGCPKQFELICSDPPYNYGVSYDNCSDSKSAVEYERWTRQWITACIALLSPHGSFWVFAPDEWVSEIDIFCRQEQKLYKRSHVVWFYTFGVANQKSFSRSHTHLLYYTAAKTKFTFNADAVRVPSARMAVYGDKRQNPKGKLPDNTWMLLKDQMQTVFQPDMDTWLENRVCGNYKEREKDSPNQIPLPVMERIVRACSNPGDTVMDPFSGSGTTALAALKHGRNAHVFEQSPRYVENSVKRIRRELAGQDLQLEVHGLPAAKKKT
jgi:site-specific DNA-methyltransferase (adenine-specific)